MNNKNLTEGVIWKKMIIYFLPIFAGAVFQQLYNAVDAIVVSKFVGTEALAAVGGSSAQIINILIGFLMSLCNGATVVIAQEFGAKEEENVNKATHTAITFCILAGILVAVFTIPFTRDLHVLMNTPADTIDDATTYLKIYFLGSVFVLLFNMGSGILRAVGDSKRPFYYLLVSCLTNIILDLVFVIVFKWGVAGVAIATVIAQGLSSLLILIYMAKTDECIKLSIKKFGMNMGILKSMMKIGIPTAIAGSMYSISNSVIQAVGINSLGTSVVASWSMSGKIDGIFWGFSNAGGAAVLNFIAQNYGAKDLKRVKEAGKWGFILFETGTVILSLGILILSPYILPIFSNDEEVIYWTLKILQYFVPFYFTWIPVEMFTSILRGCGDVQFPTLFNIVGVVGVRLIWVYTAFRIYPTLRCLSTSYPVSWIVTDLLLAARYFFGKWNKLEIEQKEIAAKQQ